MRYEARRVEPGVYGFAVYDGDREIARGMYRADAEEIAAMLNRAAAAGVYV